MADIADTEHAEPDAKRRRVDTDAAEACGGPTLNPAYTADAFISGLRSAYDHSKPYRDAETGAELLMSPFTACVVPNLVGGAAGEQPDEFLKQLMSELKGEHWNTKNNDLYNFVQTDDLKSCTRPRVKALCRWLATDVLQWMQRVTGYDLDEGKLDVFAARYPDTGTLLCHDDRLDGRKVAFILYLTEDWTAECGGALELFDTDAAGLPADKVHAVVPQWNTFAFFTVSTKSFHQVQEVTAPGRERWSITGWYHDRSPPIPDANAGGRFRPTRDIQPAPISDHKTFVLSEWISETYLSDNTMAQLNKAFVDNSSVQLQDFLLPAKYSAVAAALGNGRTRKMGPPLYRCYGRIEYAADALLLEFAEFLASDAFAEYLRQVTNLDIASCGLEMRRFAHGDYTLLHDGDPLRGTEALDVQFVAVPEGQSEWQLGYGGATTYLAGDEDLLTVVPKGNSLSLVFRDTETMRFVKYINHTSQQRSFCDVEAIYSETAPPKPVDV